MNTYKRWNIDNEVSQIVGYQIACLRRDMFSSGDPTAEHTYQYLQDNIQGTIRHMLNDKVREGLYQWIKLQGHIHV